MEAVRIETALAALIWSVRDPSERAGVAAHAVARIENGVDTTPSTVDALRRAIEAADVISITESGKGPGAAFREGAQPS